MLSPRMPELSALEVFVTVAGAGSLNAAAGVLGVSQQAVSARIAALERQSGVTLVTRTPRGSLLTPAGAVVAEWASRLLSAAGEMDAGLAALRGDIRTTLRIAASLTIAEYLLPAWLVRSQAGWTQSLQPPVTVELTVTNSVGVAARVVAGQATVGFLEGPTPPQGLRHRVVGHDRLLVVVLPTHPWAVRHRPITAARLAQTPLVVREQGSGTRDVLAAALENVLGAGADIAPASLSLPTTAAIRAAVLAGAGPTVISELAVRDDLAAGRLRAVAVEGLDLRRDLRAVWSSSVRLPSGPAGDLVDLAARSAGSAGSARSAARTAR